MHNTIRKRNGFDGEKRLNITLKTLSEAKERKPSLFPVYITQMGYFPKAACHYRERKNGCKDNILIYCLEGKGHYVLDNKHYEVTSNQFVILPATENYLCYWADTETPWTIYWVHFTGENIDAFNFALNLNKTQCPIPLPFNGRAKALELWQNIYETLKTGYKISNLCRANFCLYHLLATFLFPLQDIQAGSRDEDYIVNKAVQIMQENIHLKLTVEQIAGKVNLSPSYFAMLFRRTTGAPPIDYFINLKMQKACELLNINNHKISTIALDFGYDDPYYFSRIFKKCIGLSPSQYRNKVQNAG
ncbi:AraC family transcriptional regulator [Mucilaginibacter sp. SP1R1]|uniref:AraC family transcriptional regulator n=1 Tax=Mucilaginibacter sp. SP1R1 TaxID=2723091 RepID=UPI0016221997|nr:AraC family transcriptional regulator [Mucilaginibacter sp. SP1R1]MBB6151677.1 AraC-like DNA-binding protein [Mucilaginibacter sp. SP1R1]